MRSPHLHSLGVDAPQATRGEFIPARAAELDRADKRKQEEAPRYLCLEIAAGRRYGPEERPDLLAGEGRVVSDPMFG
jgi:hypothetical protein